MSSELQQLPNVKDQRTITSRIDGDFPSSDTIKTILAEEQKLVGSTLGLHRCSGNVQKGSRVCKNLGVEDFARLYELAYAFIASFQRNGISIFVGFGSHLGARRHHGEFF